MSTATLRNRVAIGQFLNWSNVSFSGRSKTPGFLKYNRHSSYRLLTIRNNNYLSSSCAPLLSRTRTGVVGGGGAVLGKCDIIGSSPCQPDYEEFNCDCKHWRNKGPTKRDPTFYASLTDSNITQQQRRHFSAGRSRSSSALSNLSWGSRKRTIFPFFGLGGDIMTTQPLTVCVEGNIGSGKTTFLKHFKSNPEVCVFDEPISKWRDCQGYNLLDLMYKDPRKWSLCFQSYVQLTMLDLHTKPVVQPIKMMERSIYSAHYCFVKNLRDEGLMDEAQYAVLSEWFNFSTANLPIKLDLIVYLRTDPEVAHQRIAERGRSEENSIKLEYLQSVHELHENWLVRNQKSLPCPVLTIDANLELEDMAPNYILCEERLFQKPAVANC